MILGRLVDITLNEVTLGRDATISGIDMTLTPPPPSPIHAVFLQHLRSAVTQVAERARLELERLALTL